MDDNRGAGGGGGAGNQVARKEAVDGANGGGIILLHARVLSSTSRYETTTLSVNGMSSSGRGTPSGGGK